LKESPQALRNDDRGGSGLGLRLFDAPDELSNEHTSRDFPVADRCEDVVDTLSAEFTVCVAREAPVLSHFRQAEIIALQFATEDVASEIDRPGLSSLANRMADVIPGLARSREFEPILFGRLAGAREDFDRIAVFQSMSKRHQPTIHLRTGAVRADLAMDRVGEIDRSGSTREIDDFSGGREDEYFVREEIELHGVEKFVWVRDFSLPLDQLPEPVEFRIIAVGFDIALLVFPVRSNAEFSISMHLDRPDLDFHTLAVLADHGRMERSVPVRLRQSDIVFESPRHRWPYRMDLT